MSPLNGARKLSPRPSWRSAEPQLEAVWAALARGADDLAADELAHRCIEAHRDGHDPLPALEEHIDHAGHHNLIARAFAAVLAEVESSESALGLRRAVRAMWPADPSIGYLLDLANRR